MDTGYTYKEACDVLGYSQSTLSRAIAEGVLTPIKREHTSKKYFARGHVDALIGQSLREAKRTVLVPSPAPTEHVQVISPTYTIAYPDKGTLQYMTENNVGLRVAHTPDGVMLFQHALSDEHGSLALGNVAATTSLIMAILVGLILILFGYSIPNKETATQLEHSINTMGIDKEELKNNPGNVVATLRNHPTEIIEMKSVLERAGYAALLQAA